MPPDRPSPGSTPPVAGNNSGPRSVHGIQATKQELAAVNVALQSRVAELIESEAHLRLAVDRVPVLIWIDDAHGNRFANRAYLQFIGARASDIEHGGWHDFVHPDDRERYLGVYHDAAERNVPFEAQVRFRRADGNYRWMKSTAVPRTAMGFTGFVGSKTDITEMKEAELALTRAHDSRNEFLAMLAHELRNPLAPMRNAVQLLQARKTDPATVTWAAATLDRQVHKLTLLVNDLLDSSRVTHGKINLRREPIDLITILRRVAQDAEPATMARRQTLAVELPDHPVPVLADGLRLEQVFGNLLNNASKFTPEGGHIWIEATEPPGTGQVMVTVRDDGGGIAADVLPEVFELFSQGDRSQERTQGGLGIGLTVVRRLVELHGGEVSARSDGPGLGSEFTVRLPIAAGSVTTPLLSQLKPGVAGARSGTVLLVDDNVDARDGLAQLLRARGYQVDVAYDGIGALDAVRRSVPRAVLLDIGLPGQDGYDVARTLRAELGLEEATMVIALTGYAGPDERNRARDAGFDHFLVKPVDFETLIGLLDRTDEGPAPGQ